MPFSFLPRMIYPHLTDVTAEALRARGMRDARKLTWAHNAEITAGVYREAMEHWRKEHAQAGH